MHTTFGQSGNCIYRQPAPCGRPSCSCCSWRPRYLRSMRPVPEEDWGPQHHLQHHHDHQSDIKRFQYVSKLLSSCHQVIANTLLNTNMDIVINNDNKSGIRVFLQSESCKSSFRSELMTRQDNNWTRAKKWKWWFSVGDDPLHLLLARLLLQSCLQTTCQRWPEFQLSTWLPFFLLPPPWQTITKKIIFPSQRPTTNMNAELETSWRPSPDRKPRGTSAGFASEWVRGKCLFSFSDLC